MTETKKTSALAGMAKKAWNNPMIKNALTTFVVGIVTKAFTGKSKNK